jgi:SEC-C motif domain protein
MTDSTNCPCGSKIQYAKCCGAVISGRQKADTAEALMRSRYSAYVIGDIAYVLKTWHPSTRPQVLDADTLPKWYKLEILRTEKGQVDDDNGIVEFKAYAFSQRKSHILHEVSSFVKEKGHWQYVSGDGNETFTEEEGRAKVGRNSPCPCASGKKYKKCCG